jgi:hypothetical protein
MMEAAEYRKGLDAALNLGRSGNGLLMGESLMRPCLVLEARELGDGVLKVRLAEDEHVVEQFASQGADNPFRLGVHVRRTDRGTHDARVDRGEGAHKARSELRVAVADQHLRCVSIKRGIARLLRAPRVCGRVGHGGVDDRASPHFPEAEDEDLSKPAIVGLDEVGRPRDVVTRERRPALAVASTRCPSAHVALDGPPADANAELEQLAADPLGAPAGIARSKLSNERDVCRRRPTHGPRVRATQREPGLPLHAAYPRVTY